MEIEREYYLELRQESHESICQLIILRQYFNHMTDEEYEEEFFNFMLSQAIEDDPELQKKISWMYPYILICFDKLFNINILNRTTVVNVFGDNHSREEVWFF